MTPPRHQLPGPADGLRVGLFGGSFDPPHAGHARVTEAALGRFGLDRVWWLVSPGNPLKSRGPASMERRLAASRSIMRHPRVSVTDLEALIGARRTWETIGALGRLYPRTRFVWLMGADNLARFHLWENWRSITARVPVGVLARPGHGPDARGSPMAQLHRGRRLPQSMSRLLAERSPPAWCFVTLPMRSESSTGIREAGGWP